MKNLNKNECGTGTKPVLAAGTRLNGNGDFVSREIFNCQHGEINRALREIFCNRYKEFCKFVCVLCVVRVNKQKL